MKSSIPRGKQQGGRRKRWLIVVSLILCVLVVVLWQEILGVIFTEDESHDGGQIQITKNTLIQKSVLVSPKRGKMIVASNIGRWGQRSDNNSISNMAKRLVDAFQGLTKKPLRNVVLNQEKDIGVKYLMAKPLPGQVSSDEYFTPSEGFSSFWCGGPPGNKNVFGHMLDPRHYCIIRNICINEGKPTLFVKDRKEIEGMDGDVKAYTGLPHCVFRDVGQFIVNSNNDGQLLAKARSEGNFLGGLTALISSSYGQQHITHFMESLGQMFHALNVFGYYSDHGGDGGYLRTPLGPTLDAAPEGLSNHYAFNRSAMSLKYGQLERVLVAGAGGVNPDSFNEYFYRMLYTNRRQPGEAKAKATEYRPRTIESLESFDGKCFDELLLVGASYDPFHQTHTPSYFRQRDWFLGFDSISPDEQAEAAAKLAPPISVPSEALAKIDRAVSEYVEKASDNQKTKRPIRRVLVAHRKEKRTVANAAELDQWLATRLPVLLPQYEWQVRSVYFGTLKNHERIQLAHWADILMGIHGADLTNLVNMKPASVVVEFNMLFFFESRFREMARSLQMHYFAWTCTRRDCTNVWSGVVRNDPAGHWIYDYETERIRLNPSLVNRLEGNSLEKFKVHAERTRLYDGWFKWPTDRYVGFDCLGCDIMSCCTSMQETLYGAQRESDVIFHKKEFEELLVVMKRAAESVGTVFVPDVVLSFAERLEAAVKANREREVDMAVEGTSSAKNNRGKPSTQRQVAMPALEDRMP